LDNIILSYFLQVFHQQCGWHLITCGWDQHCPACSSASDAIK